MVMKESSQKLNNMLNGNQTKIWRIVIIAALGACLSIGGWIFTTVRDVPAKYVTKVEIRETIKDQNRRLTSTIREQNTKLESIDEKVTEINTFLRNYFSGKLADGH